MGHPVFFRDNALVLKAEAQPSCGLAVVVCALSSESFQALVRTVTFSAGVWHRKEPDIDRGNARISTTGEHVTTYIFWNVSLRKKVL